MKKSRITKRYDGKISDTIKQILTEGNSIGLKTKKDVSDIDQTLNNYNFIGNNKKPFYIINWLSRRSVSAENQKLGKSAGYFSFMKLLMDFTLNLLIVCSHKNKKNQFFLMKLQEHLKGMI